MIFSLCEFFFSFLLLVLRQRDPFITNTIPILRRDYPYLSSLITLRQDKMPCLNSVQMSFLDLMSYLDKSKVMP